jgi:hypothetical protein
MPLWIRPWLLAGKFVGSVVALVAFLFGVYQFYDSNIERRKERAAAQVERYQNFASSSSVSVIRSQSENGDGRTYNLSKFPRNSAQFIALLNFFNLAEGIAYLYNEGTVDKTFIDANLLCSFEKQYRTFILGQSGVYGAAITNNRNGGVFPVGTFENLDKLHRHWASSTFNGQPVEGRCGSQWSPT